VGTTPRSEADTYVFEEFPENGNDIPPTKKKARKTARECRRINSEQISFILGKNLVITIREDSNDIFGAIKTRLQAPQNFIRKKGADYLVHALIDVIVDGYFNIVEVMGDKIEALEEKVTATPDPKIVKEIHAAKREMIYLRKSIWPLREVISGLQHHTDGLIENETVVYLKDVYDHTIQIIDTVETYRDFLAGMLEVYLSSISNRLNEVMKVLTVFAAIFIPLTFVTSLFGMNFDRSSPYNMPELGWRYGYIYALCLMLIVVVIMLIFFKRKKWW
jgi:magnesium transporter